MEEKKKKKASINKDNIGFAIISCVVMLLSVGIAIYFCFYANNPNARFNKGSKNGYTQEDFEKLIADELDILYSKTSLDELTNEEMTLWAYKQKGYDIDSQDPLSESDLKKVINESSLRKLNVELTDIYDRNESYAIEEDEVCRVLKNGVYEKSTCDGHITWDIYSYYSKVVDYKVDGNKYYISIKNLFSNVDNPYELYTYANNNNLSHPIDESLLTSSNSSNSSIKKAIEANWKDIAKKLATYNYVFTVNDGEIILTDFSVEESEEMKNFNVYKNSLTDSQKEIIDKAEEVIDYPHGPGFYYEFNKSKKIKDISNDLKLWLMGYAVSWEDLEEHTGKELVEIAKKLYGSSFNVKHGDFYCFKYNKYTDRYTSTGGFGFVGKDVVEKRLKKYEEKNNKYYLTYSMLFLEDGDSGPAEVFIDIDDNEVLDNNDFRTKISMDEYLKIESKLPLVTFVIEKYNDNFVLTEIIR